jgi:LmbE family N-acetylglucosaminyl deacetylase
MAPRALAVAAHPDDIEFGCGGTAAAWADAGVEVTFCIVTDGSTGTTERDARHLAEVRREEAESAARILGAKEVMWLGYRDGYVEYSLDLRRDIARVFRSVRPHRFLVMDPAPVIGDWFINHPDHQAIGRASLDVVPAAGTTPGHFPELLEAGFEPWRGLTEVWLMGPRGGPVAVDISATVERKIEALACHRSQVGDDAEGLGDWIRERTAEAGKEHGYGFAESFTVLSRGPGFHDEEQSEEDLPPAAGEARSTGE